MAGKDAEVTVGADASALERAAAVGKIAWIEAGRAITSAVGDAARAVVTDLGNVALAQGRVNFAAQHQGVREFEASSARMAVAVNRDLASVRADAERTGLAIGKRPQEVMAWSRSVADLTYNVGGAREAMTGMSQIAALTGRSVDDYRGLAAELGTVGHVAGDTSHAVGMIVAQSERFNTVGGPAAFASQVESLSDVISQFAVKSEADFLKVTAAAGALTQGMGDAQAKRVQQGAFGAIASDPLGWSRVLGRDITNAQGQVEHPEKILAELAATFKKRYGKQAKTALQYNFGAEVGAAMYNADFGKAAEAAGMAPSTAAADAQKKYLGTDAGKREVADARLAEASRDLMGSSSRLGRAADAMQQFASNHPLLSTFGATALGGAASGFMGQFGKGLSTIMGGKGEGGGVGGLLKLTGAGGIAAGLSAVALAAGSVTYAFAEIKGTADEIYGNRDKWGSFVDDLKAWAFDKPSTRSDVGTKNGAAYRAAEQKNLDLAHAKQKMGALATLPGLSGMGDVATVDALKKALADGVKIEVTNAADTPVQVTVKGGSSSSAGNQGNG